METELCKTCHYYMPLGKEGSGILFPDKTAEWVYVVGRCNQPKSVHGGYMPPKFGDSYAKQEKPRENLPEWVSCEYYKRKK